MSEQSRNPNDATLECSICGHNGFPGDICPTCDRPLTQERQFTLSEIRSGRAPDPHGDRPSGAGPRIVNLPGSGGPGGQ